MVGPRPALGYATAGVTMHMRCVLKRREAKPIAKNSMYNNNYYEFLAIGGLNMSLLKMMPVECMPQLQSIIMTLQYTMSCAVVAIHTTN